jgi:energy-coupling factor transporter ATP-binding protein EcfA2
MFKRIYVHNFRCLENFALPVGDQSSALLIGKNGTGKSTLSFALALLQKLARGTNRVGQLVKPKDFFLGRTDAPMRFEVDIELGGELYQYSLALELPPGFGELRVLSEQLMVAGQPVYGREHARVFLGGRAQYPRAEFGIDYFMIALPIIQEESETDPVFLFKRWLARSVIIAPVPCLITGESSGETLEPDRDVQNLGAWFAGLIAHFPAAYTTIDGYLKNDVLPDFWDVKNPLVGGESRSLMVQFRRESSSHTLPFVTLSDGEKCFFICALVLAANEAYGPIFCFWDEPDSHLAIDEVGHFVNALRRSFENGGGQVLMTSHNDETIRRFSDENTMVLLRESHLEPTRVKTLKDLGVKGDLIGTLLRGDVDT